ncbi:MAG: methenyltetrahydrofolate cyclohydrolase [candidate division Zixibacteria bacterium]|nr:methenyltetrahydrofolate cyclohydrolase [candidate division Zixibacteria bacterium]
MTYGSQKIEEFLDTLASSAPVPGGGSVAALAGALGASLLAMVGEITMGKKKPEDKTAIEEALKLLGPMRERFVALIDEDAAAFEKVMAAFRMPKEEEGEREARKAAVEEATIGAASVPMETARTALAALEAGEALAEWGAKSAVSDVACGALCLEAAARSAAYNIQINVAGMEDPEARALYEGVLAEIDARLRELSRVRDKAESRIG